MRAFAVVPIMVGSLMLQTWGVCAEALQNLPKWKLEDKEGVPEAVEKLVRETPLDQRGAIEDALIAVVGSADATLDSRQYACRMLQRIGTKKCVPVLSGLLTEKDYSHYARLALERMVECPEAGQALKDALGKAADPLKVGIIASLGERREAAAVAEIQKLASHADPQVATTAFLALGKIGGVEIMNFLKEAKAAGPVASARVDALLVCAGGCEGRQAADVYDMIYKEEKRDVHRAGAIIGLVRTDGPKAASIILDLIRGKDSYLRRVALGCVANDKSAELTKAVAGALKDLPVGSRAELIGLLAARGDSAAVDGIAGCLQDDDKGVRDAAILAVGALGDGSHVPLLLKCANDDATRETVLTGLAAMSAADTDDALIAALRDDALVLPAIKAVAKRDCAKAVPELMRLAKTGQGAVQSEAWAALGTTASAADMDAMITALLEIKDDKLRGAAGNAVKNACSLSPEKQVCLDAALKHYPKADEDTKEFILELAAVAGGPKALELVREELKAESKRLSDKAVRSLCAWPDASATEDLMKLARNAPDEKTGIIALRGFITVAEREGNEGKRLKLFTDVRDLVKRPDDKKLLVSKLRGVRNVAAINMLSEYVLDAEVCNEASAAAVDLARAMRRGNKAELKALMEKVVASCKDKGIVNGAKGLLKDLSK